jgi:hypothetical protein
MSVEPTAGRGYFVAGLFLAIILLIVAISGFYSTNWYSQSESGFGITISMDYGLSQVEGTIGPTTVSLDYDDIQSQSTVSSPIIDVADRTRGIMTFGLIILAIFMLLAGLGAAGRAGDAVRRATPIAGYLAGLIFLVAAIYFAIYFPDAVADDNSSDVSGSLGAAWTAVLLGSLLMLIGAEITRRAPSGEDYYMPYEDYPTV